MHVALIQMDDALRSELEAEISPADNANSSPVFVNDDELDAMEEEEEDSANQGDQEVLEVIRMMQVRVTPRRGMMFDWFGNVLPLITGDPSLVRGH